MPFSLRQLRAGLCLFLYATLAGQASAQALQNCLEKARTPLATLECFRGIPYRADGALDEHGRWTTWANSAQKFSTPGLNCSGLTFAASRALQKLQEQALSQKLTLEQAMRDRLGDSGVDAPMGQDWDFGLDLILNLTEGLPRTLIPNPYEDQNIDSHLWNAIDLRGADIDSTAMADILATLQPDHIYYFAISKTDSRFKGGISFYHVGILIKDGSNIWMYHATAKGGVYRVNLAGEKGLAWLRHFYGTSSKGPRYMQLVEIALLPHY